MKKKAAVLAALAVILSFAACGNTKASADNTAADTSVSAESAYPAFKILIRDTL